MRYVDINSVSKLIQFDDIYNFCHCIRLVNIYAVSVSTVPSESAFSASNKVLTDDRNRLGNKTFEMLLCLKDWPYVEVRDHDQSNMYDNSEYVTSNFRFSRYDSDNVPQDDNKDEY
jgi:hAT family C-terminal dimerisation region